MDHSSLANAIRALTMDAVQAANSGHPGMPMGMADVATVLWQKHLKITPKNPAWQNRDRFVLSAGHGSMLIYALLYLTGFDEMDIEQIQKFRQLHSKTPGHPEYGVTAGVDCTTGPLGQGIAMAVGMAMAERLDQARFGPELVNHHTYAILGDGCLMEGISQEAISFAGHHKLSKLVVFWDDNQITIDGPVALASSEDQIARFKAAGWHCITIDGHDPVAIDAAIEQAKSSDKPSFIACQTTIGYGAPTVGGTAEAHGKALGEEEITKTRTALNWPHDPFVIPEDIKSAWEAIGMHSHDTYQLWLSHLEALDEKTRTAWDLTHGGNFSEALSATINAYKEELVKDTPKIATRKASEDVIERICNLVPGLIGGSADLSGSNNTKAGSQNIITPDNHTGTYLHYGVREFGMAAIMNGLALHGGFIPYGGTFLVFSDYMRPAMRLSALQKQRVIYVLSHDSIGLGEDGPTHHPIEHLASLRAIPNMRVFRPADATETAECWQAALLHTEGPSCLVLSRQNVPSVRESYDEKNRSISGAYLLYGELYGRDITLVATGAEVALALSAAKQLEKDNAKVAVVSMPSWECFMSQAPDYQLITLGDAPILAVEAGSNFGWTRFADDVIAMEGFSASGPGPELFRHFGFTTSKIVKRAQRLMKLLKEV